MLKSLPSPRIAALAATLVIPTLRAPAAEAQTAPAAEALFRAGRQASQRGDARTACEKFRESYRLDPAFGTLLNIAICEAALGKLADAWRHHQEVIHGLPSNDRRVAIAQRELRALEPRLPWLTITPAPGAPAELEVRLGDAVFGAGSFGVALPIDPGTYVIEARAAAREPRRYPIEIREGDRIHLEVEPGPERAAEAASERTAAATAALPVAPAPSPKATAGGRSAAPAALRISDGAEEPDFQRVAGYALVGAGAASLLTSAVCFAFVLDRLDTVDENCPGGTCNREGLAARDSGEGFYTTAMITLGTGIAVAATGAFLLLTDSRPSTSGSAASDGVRARLAPAPAGSLLGAGVRVEH